jgi:acetyltransferase-like isoleucine patch superfamily enzyme
MRGARIGANCNIGEHCFIEDGVEIGDEVVIKNGIAVYAGVRIEDGAFIGPNAVFTNEIAPRSGYPKPRAPTVVRRGASIGANATIVANTEIGAYASVGAGTVVTRDVPPHALVYGIPARQRGWVCVCGERLHRHDGLWRCECGRAYDVTDGQLVARA